MNLLFPTKFSFSVRKSILTIENNYTHHSDIPTNLIHNEIRDVIEVKLYTGCLLISVACLGINNLVIFWSLRAEILKT